MIDCARDICDYIHETHGRFPRTLDAIHVPGIWLQVHHLEIEYYEKFFQHGLTSTHREHDTRWHPETSENGRHNPSGRNRGRKSRGRGPRSYCWPSARPPRCSDERRPGAEDKPHRCCCASLNECAMAVDRKYGWHRLPRPLGLLVLFGVRNVLREKNLFDTNAQPAVNLPRSGTTGAGTPGPAHDRRDVQRPGRAADGHGRLPVRAQRARFAQMFQEPQPEIMTPNPREVSRRLLTRRPSFNPPRWPTRWSPPGCSSMIRDWFSHGPSPKETPVGGDARRRRPVVRAADADPAHAARPDRSRRTASCRAPTSTPQTHWWDVSQIYGVVRDGAEAGPLRRGRQAAHRRGRQDLPIPRTRPSTRPTCPGSGSVSA